MDSANNSELPTATAAPLTTSNALPHMSDDAPLSHLMGKNVSEMTEDELRAHVETLRALRKIPQKLASAMTTTTSTKRATKVGVRKVEIQNLADQYGD